MSRYAAGPPTVGFSGPGPIGSSAWHRALKVANAPPRTSFAGVESVATLKHRAEAAIPAIKRRLQRWDQGFDAPAYWAGTLAYGKDAAARNTAYTSMWHQLEPDRGRYWFAAAGMVTGRGGIKSMESWAASLAGLVREERDSHDLRDPVSGLARDVPTPDDLHFVISGNAFLYPFNLHNYFILREKREVSGFEGLRGDDLDRGLVVLEQTLVQQFIESYPWPNKALRELSLGRISAGFFSSASNAFVREAIVSSGRAFSFANLDTRIWLGFALVAKLRRLG